MEIYFDTSIASKVKNRFFFMRHEGFEPISWESKELTVNESTFRDINGFWAYLPEETQEEIFNLYRLIHETYNNVFELNTTYTMVNQYVVDLYKLHPFELIEYWMRTRSSIRYPDDLKSELSEDDRPEQTYLEPDYKELTVFSVALKVMVPVWAEYISLDTGMSEMNREIFAMKLLNKTVIYDSKVINRFKEFVDVVVAGQQTGMKNIIDGIGSLQMPEFILSQLIVTRLSVHPLSHNDDIDQTKTINLIKVMWQRIRNIIVDNGGRGGYDDIKSKNLPHKTGDEEDNLSTAESYKAKESISDGERITFDFAGRRIKEYFYQRILGTDEYDDLLKRQYRRNLSRKFFNPTEEQIKLTELVISKVFPTRALPHTNRGSAITNLSVAQVALHQRGFSILADLLGANRLGETHSIVNTVGIKKEQIDILDEIYSYRRNMPLRGSRNKTTLVNPGIVAVDALYQAFSHYHWERDIDDQIAQASSMIESEKGWVVPFNFKSTLADFIINLNDENNSTQR